MSDRVDLLSVWRMYDFFGSYMLLHAAFLSLKRCDLKERISQRNEVFSKWDRRLTTDAGHARGLRFCNCKPCYLSARCVLALLVYGMATDSASEAEEIAEIECDWNAFDMRAVLLKCRGKADMNGITVKLKVSDLCKEPQTSYLVSIDAKSRYAIHLKSKPNAYKAYEGTGDTARQGGKT